MARPQPRSIDEILADLLAATNDTNYGTPGNGQGYDVQVYDHGQITELSMNLGLITPASGWTLQQVYDAVEGLYYNPNSNFATIQTNILNDLDALIIANTPDANDDSGAGFSTDEDSSFTTASVLVNDTDPQNDTLSVSGVDVTGTVGTVIDNGDGTFQYDPNGQFEFLATGETATDTFSYTVSDGNGQFDTAQVTVEITGADEGPPPGIHDLNDGSGTYVGTAGLVDHFIFDIDVGTTDGINSLISITNFEMGVDKLVFQADGGVDRSYFDHRYSDGLGHENIIGEDGWNLMHVVSYFQSITGIQPNNGDNEFSIFGEPGNLDSIQINNSGSDVAPGMGAWGPDTPHYSNGAPVSSIGSAYNAANDDNIELYFGMEVTGVNPEWYDGLI